MLETQYKREVEDKLEELKLTIQGVAINMRMQSELISKKTIESQDKVDCSIAALQLMAS